jgi:ABC-type glycerol-3-phosphate transport system substrate-binding protein
MDKKSFLVFAGVAALLLAGCATPRDASAGSGPATITFSHWGVNTEEATLSAMIKEFESENPGIKVEDNWIQNDYEQSLTTAIGGGQEPDVAQISNAFVPDLASAFKPVAVNPADYYTANVAAGMKYQGQYYGVPFVIKPNVMAVNEAIFRSKGVAVPSTTDPMSVAQFAKDATALSSGSGSTKVYGSAPLWYNQFLKAYGGDFFTSTGTCTIDTPAAISAANLIVQAQSAGGFAPTLADSTGQDMFYWLSIGRLAMQPDFGPWDISKLTGLSSSDFQLVPAPGRGSQTEVDGIAISKNLSGAKLAAAEKFTEFMSKDIKAQSLLTTSKASLGVPVTQAALKGFYATAPKLNLKAFVIAAGQAALGASIKNYGNVTDNIDNALSSQTAMGSGHDDPAGVLAGLQSKCPAGLNN